MMNFSAMPPGLIQQLLKKQQAQPTAPMAYNPGAMRQFTPSPAPDVPFMPAPQVGPQQIPTGFGTPPGGLAGLGGPGPNIGPGMPAPPSGPNIGPGMPSTQQSGPQLNPQIAQHAMALLQRSRSAPMQMNLMQMLRGGR